ncbi:YbhB/YbcL family Raf kinase inhibitor-like protein [Actinotalea sp.]|uniref:YbhB/YbcL family Raf kinase inhibitor-like protein n=1 Tax=Actinotalea sp. TaxID=1872145 RepID=UPI003562AF64
MDLDRPIAPEPYGLLPTVPALTLRSDDLEDGVPMPGPFTAEGGSTSPELHWSAVPPGTQSVMISCFDPDAPTPAGYWHWTVWDLPADIGSLPTGAGTPSGNRLPAGARQARHDGGEHGYLGAAPPPGDRAHRYVFAVHALDTPSLGLTEETTPTSVAFTALFHTLARGTLTPTFQH